MNSYELKIALSDLNKDNIGTFLRIYYSIDIWQNSAVIDKVAYCIDSQDIEALEYFFDIIIREKKFFLCKYPWHRELFQKYLKEHATEDRVIKYLDTYPMELIQLFMGLNGANVIEFLKKHKNSDIMQKSAVRNDLFWYIRQDNMDVVDEFFDTIITNKIFHLCEYSWYQKAFQKYLKEHATEDKVISYLDMYPTELSKDLKKLNKSNIAEFLRKYKNEAVMQNSDIYEMSFEYVRGNDKDAVEAFFDSMMINKTLFISNRSWYFDAFNKYLNQHVEDDTVISFVEACPDFAKYCGSATARSLNNARMFKYFRKVIMEKPEEFTQCMLLHISAITNDSNLEKKIAELVHEFGESINHNELFAIILEYKLKLFEPYILKHEALFQKYLENNATEDKIISFIKTYPTMAKYCGIDAVLSKNKNWLFEHLCKVIMLKPEEFTQCMLLHISNITNDSNLEKKIAELVLKFSESINHNELFAIIIKYKLNSFEPYILRYEALFQNYLETNATNEDVITFLLSNPISNSLRKSFLEKIYNTHLKDIIQHEEHSTNVSQNIFDDIHQPENNYPMVKIKSDSKPIHLRFDMSERPNENTMSYYYKHDYGDPDFYIYFARYQSLVEKLYNDYYKSYQKIAKPENESLYDFIKAILFSKTNFKNVVLNNNYSVMEIRQLMRALPTYNHPKAAEVQQFYNSFFQQEALKWNKIYSWFINNRQNGDLISERLTAYKLTEETAYNFFLKNKFLNKFQKTNLIGVLDYHFGKGLRLIDIIDLLEEMSTKELTLDEILVEKDIEKGTFMKLYRRSAEQNPDLHNFIAVKLRENKIRGFKKMIKFGHSILSSDASSFEEYNQKYPDCSIEEVLKALRRTELYKPIMLKVRSWPDYIPYENEEELIESEIKK